MKYSISKNIGIVLFGLALATTGCDKEENWLDVASKGAQASVGFGETFIDGQPVFGAPDAGTIDYPVQVFLSGTSGSATVSVTEDPSLVAAYNEANGTDYPQAPAGYYTLPTSIPVSGKSGSANATFNLTGLYEDIGEFVYAVGLRINDVSGATSNVQDGQDELVLIITIQNQYEADYAVKGYFVHPSSPRALILTKHISTVSAVRCEAGHSDLYTSNYYFQFDVDASNNLVNYSAVGSTPPVPASNFMTEDNPAGVATYPGPPYTSDVYNNTYDPEAKIFWMHYGYGVGTTSQASYTRQAYEKWTRL